MSTITREMDAARRLIQHFLHLLCSSLTGFRILLRFVISFEVYNGSLAFSLISWKLKGFSFSVTVSVPKVSKRYWRSKLKEPSSKKRERIIYFLGGWCGKADASVERKSIMGWSNSRNKGEEILSWRIVLLCSNFVILGAVTNWLKLRFQLEI